MLEAYRVGPVEYEDDENDQSERENINNRGTKLTQREEWKPIARGGARSFAQAFQLSVKASAFVVGCGEFVHGVSQLPL